MIFVSMKITQHVILLGNIKITIHITLYMCGKYKMNYHSTCYGLSHICLCFKCDILI